MCILLIAINHVSRFPVVIAHNRDEFISRPFKKAHTWGTNPEIIAGVDVKNRGTWLGMTTKGRFAAITNYRAPARYEGSKTSRGALVKDFLEQNSPAIEYGKVLSRTRGIYNLYNLVYSDNLRDFYWYSSVRDSVESIPDGVHVLSNADMNTPWPKVTRLKELFLANSDYNHDAIAQNISESLLKLLADMQLAPPPSLPNTGLPMDQELAVSPICVITPTYGTVASTVLLVNELSETTFREVTFTANHEIASDHVFTSHTGRTL